MMTELPEYDYSETRELERQSEIVTIDETVRNSTVETQLQLLKEGKGLTNIPLELFVVN